MATKLKVILFRNNIGKLQDKNGTWVSYGVCNPGGSDLIGYTPVIITQDMVGKKVAVFTAVECKSNTGKVSDDQQNFIDNVIKHGGIAGVARSDQDLQSILMSCGYLR